MKPRADDAHPMEPRRQAAYSPNDPMTMAAAACGLTIIALTAGYIPAYRAARVNPVSALRYE